MFDSDVSGVILVCVLSARTISGDDSRLAPVPRIRQLPKTACFGCAQRAHRAWWLVGLVQMFRDLAVTDELINTDAHVFILYPIAVMCKLNISGFIANK